MKTIWTVIVSMCIANVLAIGGVVVWLKASDRLNMDRVKLVRQTFSRTVSAEKLDEAQRAVDAERAKQEQAQADRMAQPPRSAEATIEKSRVEDEQRLQTILRKQQELESLRGAIARQSAALEEREKKLLADREAFKAERERIAQTEGAKQFQDALTTLEGQRPKDAKMVLKALIDAKQREQAVSYLAKMEESKRSKVLAEFVKEDATLAADLLERLRTRGTVVPAVQPGSTPHDAPSAQQTVASDAGGLRPAAAANPRGAGAQSGSDRPSAAPAR